MRILLKVSLPVETANRAAVEGKLGSTIKEILEDLKPEAAYFAEEDGRRTGYIFLNMSDPSQIPRIVEPWFLAFNASVEIHPAMNPEDLAKAASDIERAAKKYGGYAWTRMPKAA